MTDRGVGVTREMRRLNVRRLMYQSLIWAAVLRDDPRSLRSPLHAEDLKRLPDALVDGVIRDPELGGNFLGAEVLVHEAETVELAAGEARDALGDRVVRHLSWSSPIIIG